MKILHGKIVSCLWKSQDKTNSDAVAIFWAKTLYFWDDLYFAFLLSKKYVFKSMWRNEICNQQETLLSLSATSLLYGLDMRPHDRVSIYKKKIVQTFFSDMDSKCL